MAGRRLAHSRTSRHSHTSRSTINKTNYNGSEERDAGFGVPFVIWRASTKWSIGWIGSRLRRRRRRRRRRFLRGALVCQRTIFSAPHHFFAGLLIFTESAVLPSIIIFTTTRCPTASSDFFAAWLSACSHVVLGDVWMVKSFPSVVFIMNELSPCSIVTLPM